MESSITLQGLVTVGGFLLAVFGAGFGLWRYFEGKVERAKSDGALATSAVKLQISETQRDLADHKLHVAEHYVTKAGMAEQTAQIIKSIDGVSGKLDHLNGRIDGLMKPAATRSRAG